MSAVSFLSGRVSTDPVTALWKRQSNPEYLTSQVMIIGHWQLALPADDCPMAGVRQVWHRGDMVIRPGDAADRDWIACKLAQRWGSTTIVTRGRPCDAASLPALIAVDTTCEHGPERVGLLTYRLDREGLEVVTIDALKTGAGIGTALLSSVVRTARNAKAGRVWLITTNDNLPAI